MTALAFELSRTVHHDGHGGVADDLDTVDGVAAWIAQAAPLVAEVLGQPFTSADLDPEQPFASADLDPEQPFASADLDPEQARSAGITPERPFASADVDPERVRPGLLELRRAIRSLFAHAVQQPTRADVPNLLAPAAAIAHLNKTADHLGTQHLAWPPTGDPHLLWSGRLKSPNTLLLATTAHTAITFLTSPDRDRLRACPAARCVKYFVQTDPRQTWCTPTCANRGRVQRHYHRTHSPTP
ncbi:putative RNA-binding Zn ribbon-like protein [Kribbella sp. VKM Ac-2527]|uniref:Putative RNA-binding Zn ribbon-like protein n=1 Tax=Kribbella caucasensis TaxID=2512215 RepID=A0A4R6K6A6_9ACTN|nr:CGNR zinc finger domain-containing protein [Kribbella sp. VKM Ac-2527]TDO44946.1 putative RNA-binding Zn ribbon-like protein [Kribbella sp. VKM Ac-2527]